MSAPPLFDPAELGRIPPEILARYDVPGPRYTSYPTAPAWSDDFGPEDCERALRDSAATARPLSVYVHIPFCESLCVYCGCNVVITRRRERAEAYLGLLEQEATRVSELAGTAGRETIQVAWGGGTPTYLAPDQIERLAATLRERFPHAPDAEVAIEVDPRVTTRDHVRAIARAGFNRISMGIQDFDPKVQEEIHRVQSFETTRNLIAWCREDGIESVNVDLVYGLPLQNLDGFGATLDRIFELSPDRISAFSYAHVPWLKPAQKKFDETTIPGGAEKFAIFVHMVERLTDGGYEFIGMDHFAKPGNELSEAQRTGGLWRNFQGFTTKSGTDLIGLGMTAISSVAGRFVQNEKDLVAWTAAVASGRLPTIRGLATTEDDRIREAVIQRIMCDYRFSLSEASERFGIDASEYFADDLPKLAAHAENGMLVRSADGFELTSRGRVFVRNVCMVFDAHLPSVGQKVFSRTI
jgi:oxygen-independent coproporphyrinogen-3 oxidase